MERTQILTMGTTIRHMEILDAFSEFSNRKKRQNPKVKTGREQIALVKNYEKLIDISELTEIDIRTVIANIEKFKYTYPDFMIFQNNPVIISDNKTRYAGIPDLIVEVWSKANSEADREQKRNLYRTNKSELWEIDQDNPIITCWNKNGEKYQQHMNRAVKTPWGEELDLTELAHDMTDVLPNDKFNGGLDIGVNIELHNTRK